MDVDLTYLLFPVKRFTGRKFLEMDFNAHGLLNNLWPTTRDKRDVDGRKRNSSVARAID